MAFPERAGVVIVGGGVMGASTAFHLAEAGVRDVVLLERDALASGSTSRAAGGVRAQFSDELNIAIALRSLEAFDRFEMPESLKHGYGYPDVTAEMKADILARNFARMHGWDIGAMAEAIAGDEFETAKRGGLAEPWSHHPARVVATG